MSTDVANFLAASRESPWATRGRNNNLDALRLMFAIGVIYSHSFPLALGPDGYSHGEVLVWLSKGWLSVGGLAVAFFFLISGYLIAASWNSRKTVGGFFKKRIARILPGYAIACLVTIALVAAVQPIGTRVSFRLVGLAMRGAVMNDASIFPNLPLPNIPNGSLWTIRYEFGCYVGLAIAGLIGLFANRWWIGILWVLSLAACFITRHGSIVPVAYRDAVVATSAWNGFVTCFIGGTAFYLYRDRIPRSNAIAVFAAILCLVSILTGKAVLTFATLSSAGAYVAFWVGYHPRICLHRATRFGDLSYGTYLYAFLVQQLLAYYIPGIRPTLMFLLAAPSSLVLAFLSWHLVERWPLRQAHSSAASAWSSTSSSQLNLPASAEPRAPVAAT